MKKSVFMSLIMSLIFSISAMAQNNKTVKFEVNGNCDMCKKRIETAAKSVVGVNSANWDKKTKIIEVSLDSTKTDVHKIHMAIAKAGHDTEMHRASDDAYNNLPGCCQYERKVVEKMKMEKMEKMEMKGM